MSLVTGANESWGTVFDFRIDGFLGVVFMGVCTAAGNLSVELIVKFDKGHVKGLEQSIFVQVIEPAWIRASPIRDLLLMCATDKLQSSWRTIPPFIS